MQNHHTVDSWFWVLSYVSPGPLGQSTFRICAADVRKTTKAFALAFGVIKGILADSQKHVGGQAESHGLSVELPSAERQS